MIREPMVRTMRQPPTSVPRAIAAWQIRTTQNGMVAIERDARIAFTRIVRELALEPPPAFNDVGHRIR